MNNDVELRICETCRVITVQEQGLWVHPSALREKFSDHVCDLPQPGRLAKASEIRWGRGRTHSSDKRSFFGSIPELQQDPETPLTIGVDGAYKLVTDDGVARKPISWGFLTTSGVYGIGTTTMPGSIAGPDRALQGELRAIWWALLRTPETHPVTIVTDSAIADWLMECWRHGRMRMPPGYQTERESGREATLVQLAHLIHRAGDRIQVEWVRGHTGQPMNEGADLLAKTARAWAVRHLTKEQAQDRARNIVLSSLMQQAELLVA